MASPSSSSFAASASARAATAGATHEIALNDEDEAGEPKSSLSKTIGNVLSLVNDGLYRLKSRSKAE